MSFLGQSSPQFAISSTLAGLRHRPTTSDVCFRSIQDLLRSTTLNSTTRSDKHLRLLFQLIYSNRERLRRQRHHQHHKPPLHLDDHRKLNRTPNRKSTSIKLQQAPHTRESRAYLLENLKCHKRQPPPLPPPAQQAQHHPPPLRPQVR